MRRIAQALVLIIGIGFIPHESFAAPASQPRPGVIASPCDKPDQSTTDRCLSLKAVEKATDSARWAFWSLFVSVGTLGAVVLGFRQNDQMQRKEFRAYLSLDHPELRFIENGCIKLDFKLVNYGRTPASAVSGNGTVNVLYKASDTTMGHKQAKLEVHSVHPGHPYRRTEITLGGYDMSAKEHVEKGTARVRVTQTLEYTDIYQKRHTDEFVFNYSGVDNEGMLLPDFSAYNS